MAKATRNRLGRGLDALLAPPDEIMTSGSSSINEIELDRIEPNPGQPRSIFEEEALEELAQSIRTYGVIQPIILKEKGDGNYLIIAGERRYRAAEIVGLDKIPAYIKTTEDENIAELALIENIQREDLNAIETALAYQRLIDANGFTQEQLSERVGKKRATVANYLRLLKLPAEIQVGLKDKRIDMGHARALLSVEDPEVQLALYEQILTQDSRCAPSKSWLATPPPRSSTNRPRPTLSAVPTRSSRMNLRSSRSIWPLFFRRKCASLTTNGTARGRSPFPLPQSKNWKASCAYWTA